MSYRCSPTELMDHVWPTGRVSTPRAPELQSGAIPSQLPVEIRFTPSSTAAKLCKTQRRTFSYKTQDRLRTAPHFYSMLAHVARASISQVGQSSTQPLEGYRRQTEVQPVPITCFVSLERLSPTFVRNLRRCFRITRDPTSNPTITTSTPHGENVRIVKLHFTSLWWEWRDSNPLTHFGNGFTDRRTLSNSTALPGPKKKARQDFTGRAFGTLRAGLLVLGTVVLFHMRHRPARNIAIPDDDLLHAVKSLAHGGEAIRGRNESQGLHQ